MTNIREAIRQATEMGRALGLKQGAAVLRKMADHKGRVVGTNALKTVASELETVANEIDRESKKFFNEHGGKFAVSEPK